MLVRRVVLATGAALLALSACSGGAPTPSPAPSPDPAAAAATLAAAEPAAEADPYLHLEDVESAETLAWIRDKHAQARAHLDRLPSRPEFHAGIAQHISTDEIDLPWKLRNGLYYYLRKHHDRDHRVLVRSRRYGVEASEEVVLDPNTWSQDGSHSLTGWTFSHDEKRLAYGTSIGGSDWTTWRILDLATLQSLSDELRGLKWGRPTFGPDNRGLFYPGYEDRSHDENAPGKGSRVYYHVIGTPQSADPAVYVPKDPEWMATPSVPPSGDFITIGLYKSSDGQERTEIFPLPKTLPLDPTPLLSIADPHVLSPDFAYRQWSFTTDPGVVYLFSEDGAPTGRVDRYTLATRKLETIVPARKETLAGVSRTGDRIFAKYIEDLKSFVLVYDLSGKQVDEIRMPFPSNMWGFRGLEWHTETFFGAAGHAQPDQIYRYDLPRKKREKVWEVEVDFTPEGHVATQVFVESKDGTKVPMFVVHRRDVPRDGTAPTLLMGYGCYGYVTPIGFAASRVPWLKKGGILAIANIRGGGEYGQAWHRAGKKQNKQNSIDDFIASAEWLQRERYTSPANTAILGASCGGLLVGATLTQRPDLVAAAVPEVGIFDLLRYHHFSGAFLWKDELGSPDVPEERAYLARLSPLEAAQKRQRYPATLITTRKKDTRVAPMNSYKFAAALAEHQSGEAPILLRVDETGGHFTGSLPLDLRIDYLADVYAFLWEHTSKGAISRPDVH